MWVSKCAFDSYTETVFRKFNDLYDTFVCKYEISKLENSVKFLEVSLASKQKQLDDLIQRYNDLYERIELLERMAQDNNVLKAYRKKCALENEVACLEFDWEL